MTQKQECLEPQRVLADWDFLGCFVPAAVNISPISWFLLRIREPGSARTVCLAMYAKIAGFNPVPVWRAECLPDIHGPFGSQRQRCSPALNDVDALRRTLMTCYPNQFDAYGPGAAGLPQWSQVECLTAVRQGPLPVAHRRAGTRGNLPMDCVVRRFIGPYGKPLALWVVGGVGGSVGLVDASPLSENFGLSSQQTSLFRKADTSILDAVMAGHLRLHALAASVALSTAHDVRAAA